ncbi:hypothetical protein Tco_0636762 [Tanacetum coccineum]
MLYCKSSNQELKKILIDKMEAKLYQQIEDSRTPPLEQTGVQRKDRKRTLFYQSCLPSETTTTTVGKTTTTGSKTHKKSASQSALVEEAIKLQMSFEAPDTRI